MYNEAQVIIDLKEYNDLKRIEENFKIGSEDAEKEFLMLTINNIFKVMKDHHIDGHSVVQEIAKSIKHELGYGLAIKENIIELIKI